MKPGAGSRAIGARLVAVAVAVTSVASAHADPPAPPTKSECVAAHTEAQHLRRTGHLRAARTELLSCASPSCPEPVTAECVPWLADLERVLPTMVFEARLADGSDAVEVSVLVDGEKVADKLDGRAISVDPGAHLVRFVGPPTAAPVERRLVVAEGEKTRLVRVDLPNAPPPGILDPVPPPVTSSSGWPHWSTYVLGGASAVSFAGFTYFGLTGKSGEDGLNGCKPNCLPARTDPVSHDYRAADIFLGVGVATAAAALIVALTTRGHASSAAVVAPASASAQVPSFDRSMLK